MTRFPPADEVTRSAAPAAPKQERSPLDDKNAALNHNAAGGILLATLLLPLVGAWLAGANLADKFRFPPPLEIPLGYVRWSWFAAGLVVAPFVAIAFSWIHARQNRRMSTLTDGSFATPVSHRPPRWSGYAIASTLLWWAIAWTRIDVVATLQRYTFLPLWLGFIATVNGVIEARTGTCLLRSARFDLLKLFGTSAAFWWVFEWLNRFVQNWHYLGVQDFGALAYATHATLCFATVLPAVASVAALLGTFPKLQAAAARGPQWRWLAKRSTGVALLVGGGAALVLTGAAPRQFYPALWSAPLALGVGAGILSRRNGIWNDLARGDWRRTLNWALAACVCGLFWELWNSHSLAKWIYTVPYVDRWHVFEMPLLGYAGYVAFGLECWFVVDLVLSGRSRLALRGDPRPQV